MNHAVNQARLIVGGVKSRLPSVMNAQQSQAATGPGQFATRVQSATPSSFGSDMYFFDKAVAIAPAAVPTALEGGTYPWITIDVQYVDYTALQGKYTLYLKLGKLP